MFLQQQLENIDATNVSASETNNELTTSDMKILEFNHFKILRIQ